jgi:hypothetical protein
LHVEARVHVPAGVDLVALCFFFAAEDELRRAGEGGGVERGIRDGDVVFLEREERGRPRELVVEERALEAGLEAGRGFVGDDGLGAGVDADGGLEAGAVVGEPDEVVAAEFVVGAERVAECVFAGAAAVGDGDDGNLVVGADDGGGGR